MTADRASLRSRLRLVPAPPAEPPRRAQDVPEPPAPVRHAVDDAELLAAARRGDASVAAALHDRVRPQVDRTVRRILGRLDADAEDLTQLALMAIVSGISRFRGDCSLDSWASSVTARVVFKHLRRRTLERRLFEREVAESEAPAGSDPSARELLARVLAHLGRIDESKAWAFLLHDVCGYDLREVATIMGTTVAAAQSRLVRGRRGLHERIAADPDLAALLETKEGTS